MRSLRAVLGVMIAIVAVAPAAGQNSQTPENAALFVERLFESGHLQVASLDLYEDSMRPRLRYD